MPVASLDRVMSELHPLLPFLTRHRPLIDDRAGIVADDVCSFAIEALLGCW